MTKENIHNELERFIESKYTSTKEAIISTNETTIQNNIVRMFKDECIGAADFLWRSKFLDINDLGYYETKINNMFNDLLFY